jgi:hypothetical protein
MTCSRNLFKHFLNCYQIKINREILQHGFSILFKSNDFFFQKKSDQIFLFSYLFLTFVQNFKDKEKDSSWHMYLNVFTLSHFEKITWIFAYDGCHNYFWTKKNFIFNIVDYRLVIKWLGAVCTFEEMREKTNYQRDECEIFTTKLGWSISPSF